MPSTKSRGNCLEIATKKMAGPRDRSTILSYGTLILSFAYDYEINDNPCTFHILCTCELRPPCATRDLRNCDRAVDTGMWVILCLPQVVGSYM